MLTLDKYLIRSLAINYVISLAVLTSLYVVLDLFFNFDEFIHDGEMTAVDVLLAVGRYYAPHLFLYFGQISGVITLFAMLFTLARLQRDNEFVALVASGVSLYRVAWTLILAGAALNGLWLINQEIMIPRLAPLLARTHEAVATNKPFGVWFVRDLDGALLSASRFDPSRGELTRILILLPDAAQAHGRTEYLMAERGTWQPPHDDQDGQWILERGMRLYGVTDPDGAVHLHTEPIDSWRSALSPNEITLRQSRNWIQFLGGSELAKIRKQGMASPQMVLRAIHNRFSYPIVNLLILVIGLPFFLDRHPANVVQAGGKCLLVCGACFIFAFVCQNVSGRSPTLMSWLPLMVLTPMMVVLLDRLRT